MSLIAEAPPAKRRRVNHNDDHYQVPSCNFAVLSAVKSQATEQSPPSYTGADYFLSRYHHGQTFCRQTSASSGQGDVGGSDGIPLPLDAKVREGSADHISSFDRSVAVHCGDAGQQSDQLRETQTCFGMVRVTRFCACLAEPEGLHSSSCMISKYVMPMPSAVKLHLHQLRLMATIYRRSKSGGLKPYLDWDRYNVRGV
jgi:hypothetical protein